MLLSIVIESTILRNYSRMYVHACATMSFMSKATHACSHVKSHVSTSSLFKASNLIIWLLLGLSTSKPHAI